MLIKPMENKEICGFLDPFPGRHNLIDHIFWFQKIQVDSKKYQNYSNIKSQPREELIVD